ncbi:hypothetical protein JNUCC64_24925 [Streptomyces sp. JNUCC 64]
MTRDALLLDGPPAETGAHCCVCGRWTTAPVVIGYTNHSGHDGTGDATGTGPGPSTAPITHHACPRHLVTGGECVADHVHVDVHDAPAPSAC